MNPPSEGKPALAHNKSDRNKIILQLLLVIFILAGLIFAASALGVFERPPSSHTVTYRITADSGYAMITFTTANGKQTEATRTTTPWEVSIPFKSGVQVYLTAGTNNASGTVSCTILLDRKAWKKETAQAPSTNVACGGIVP